MRSTVPLLLLAAALPSGAQTFLERRQQFHPSSHLTSLCPKTSSAMGRGSIQFTFVSRPTTRPRACCVSTWMQAAKSPLHDDPAGVLVCLTECPLSLNGGEEVHLRPGQTRWMTADRRITRNIGGSAVEVLYIESRKAPE